MGKQQNWQKSNPFDADALNYSIYSPIHVITLLWCFVLTSVLNVLAQCLKLKCRPLRWTPFSIKEPAYSGFRL